ncbi:MAG: hypothetical protein HYX89_04420, partial [Chloroflexi bacterium]|nr:hypothetical protein [Chloroflexota bacterium]
MAITMQGPWTVSVKSKGATYAQRFIISGAAIGNGTYAGEVATPPVSVVPVFGTGWSIRIQNNPGKGWVDSNDQIKFPTISVGQYHFDIESNDAGSDQDFNDLILTCSTPQTATDFIIYGHASYYSEGCFFNPCFPGWVIIDSHLGLLEALKHPILKDLIEKLYPDRLWYERPPIGPIPDPPPFKPIVIPLREETVLPAKQAQVFKTIALSPMASASMAQRSAEIAHTVVGLQSFTLGKTMPVAALEFDRTAVASLVDRLRPLCETGPLKGVVLKFQEYDRTNAELAGGAYSGTGNREDLGVCATDRNGNYIFRFTRSIADIAHEVAVDVAPGEDVAVQAFPDVIVQLLDPMAPGGVSYESAPYWNVSLFKQINICVPKANVPHLPTACQGQHAIQAIGNIFIGAPQVGGTRVGFNNYLGVEGRITARNAQGPQTRCAAWAGTLDFFACFLDQPTVTQYTIRFRRRLPNMSWTPWGFFQQEYRHPKIANIGLPNYSGDLVGPYDRVLNIDGGPAVQAKAYDNIENDTAWVFTRRDRKAQISSWLYAPDPGPVQFRIEGYNAGGAKVTGADDTITLYIDNSAPDRVIDPNITMGVQTLGNCALFTLPAGQVNTALTVKFKVNHEKGFLNGYELYLYKGATGYFSVLPLSFPQPLPSPPNPPPPTPP